MEILKMKDKLEEAKLQKIASGIKNGKLCLFPTETVYGIGTNGFDEKAVEKIYQAKKRDKKNPINLLVSDITMIEKIVQDISPLEYQLMKAFFPGPFTIILKRKPIIPDLVTAHSDLVGIRIPDHKIALKLIQLADVPIAAPSANISGKLSGTNFTDIIDDFSDYLDFAIDAGKSKIGMESTIVRVMDEIPHILRPGFITPEQIKSVAGNVILEKNSSSILPSAKMKHYQLDSNSTLVYNKDNKVLIDKINELSKQYTTSVVVCCDENVSYYHNQSIVPIASKYNLIDYSKNLISSLRKAALLCPDMIFVEGVEKKGLGIAIMNRLENICPIQYIEKGTSS